MIWILTSPERIHEEAVIIDALLQAGVDRIMLRKPQWRAPEYDALMEEIDPAWFPRIIVHDNFSVCNKYPVGGIHLSGKTRDHMTGCELDLCLQRYPNSSTGIHDTAAIALMHRQFDTLLLSPVFNSISKLGYYGRFAGSLPEKQRRVFAMGGVDAGNIHQVWQWGFDGAALLGAIWQDPFKAVENYQRIQEIWNRNART
ncbi:thiamine phosphate synthase [Chitinophaga solisilvae]|uniref:thiamine phosphate synthase n=1 Tax=Chitinophaga solisilvae TaxID=1233460 RepID=UPI00136D9D16|nr:thiamine phosphate synthase [Chitinophaga solisilvae]